MGRAGVTSGCKTKEKEAEERGLKKETRSSNARASKGERERERERKVGRRVSLFEAKLLCRSLRVPGRLGSFVIFHEKALSPRRK